MLVVAPHSDDLEFGMAGFVWKRRVAGWLVDELVVALGYEDPSQITRLGEFADARRVLGIAAWDVFQGGVEMKLDTLPMRQLVSWLDGHLASGFDEVYYPYPSHNQDHRYVYEAMQAALRHPSGPSAPKFAALYEYPYISGTLDPVLGGRCYVDISGEPLQKKLEALSCYKSQLREYPALSSLEAVTRLAKMRGMECGVDAAELFYVQRMRME